MSKLISFYQGKYPANGKKNYYFNDIVNKWSDYELEINHDYIQWLFPDRTGCKNPQAPHLTDQDIKVFKKNIKIRSRVINATLRMLTFYGFSVNSADWSLEQKKSAGKKEHGQWIGLYSEHNYLRITRIMRFLNQIEMSFLSVIFFLAMCEAMRTDDIFKGRVESHGSLPIWMSTQKFLQPYRDGYDIDRLKFEIVDDDDMEYDDDDMEYDDDEESQGEEVYYDFDDDDDDDDDDESSDNTEFLNTCSQFQGLDYYGNSCYQDSTLLAMFAIPNNVITDYILNRNVRGVSELQHRWTECDENIDADYRKRRDIQKELIRITNSMRRLDKTVKHCSNLRRLIQRCPGTEKFHGTGMQDAGEFLTYLFSLFQVDVAKTTNSTYVTHEFVPDPVWLHVGDVPDEHASPIIAVNQWTIEDGRERYINEFLVQTEEAVLDEPLRVGDEEFLRRRQVWRMVESPYMVFYIHRLIRDHEMVRGKLKAKERKLRTPIIPVQKIGRLDLGAIVVHQHQHYTCYIRCRNIWFFYNDMSPRGGHTINRVGTYDAMLKSRPDPIRDGTLYFYV